VVGTSTGGSIAQLLAIHHRLLVRRLVLFASAARLSPYGRRVQHDLARYSTAGRPRRAWAATGPALAATPIGGALATALMWLAGHRMGATDPTDLLITIAAEDIFDTTASLYRITAPTLVIGGARDRFYSADLFRHTARAIPGARLILYPGKGHLGTVTHRAAIEEISRFLRTDADSDPRLADATVGSSTAGRGLLGSFRPGAAATDGRTSS
jgi:pimeloyl-ACP methyl ester carboxylesterase